MPATFTSYADIEEGKSYPPFSFSISAQDLDTFESSFAIDYPGNVVATAASDARRALPVFILNHFHGIRAAIKMPDGVLHAREKITLHSAAYADEVLHMTITVASKYMKNEKPFVVLEQAISRPADAAAIMTIERTLCWPQTGAAHE